MVTLYHHLDGYIVYQCLCYNLVFLFGSIIGSTTSGLPTRDTRFDKKDLRKQRRRVVVGFWGFKASEHP